MEWKCVCLKVSQNWHLVTNLRPSGWGSGLLQDFLLFSAVPHYGLESRWCQGRLSFPSRDSCSPVSFNPVITWDFKLICWKGWPDWVSAESWVLTCCSPEQAALPPQLLSLSFQVLWGLRDPVPGSTPEGHAPPLSTLRHDRAEGSGLLSHRL